MNFGVVCVQGDTVESKKNSKGRKVYRCKAKVKIQVKELANLIK